jgi:hypothetical protein
VKELTPLVRRHLRRLFDPAEQQEAAHLLLDDCGPGLPGAGNGSAEMVERIRCAALKVSNGRIDKLYDAISLAQTDWRDLLVVAGFACDTQAHKHWRD